MKTQPRFVLRRQHYDSSLSNTTRLDFRRPTRSATAKQRQAHELVARKLDDVDVDEMFAERFAVITAAHDRLIDDIEFRRSRGAHLARREKQLRHRMLARGEIRLSNRLELRTRLRTPRLFVRTLLCGPRCVVDAVARRDVREHTLVIDQRRSWSSICVC